MRNIPDKTDSVGDVLPAADFNAEKNELQTVVTDTGQTLDPAGGPDTDLNHLGKGMAVYGSAAWRYADSGSANTYVLSRVASSDLKTLPAYYDGMAIAFEIGTTNTGPSTVNVSSIGVKDLVFNGAALSGGELIAGVQVIGFYDLANDNFELLNLTNTGSSAAGGVLTGTVKFSKIKNVVTVSWSTLSHSSANSAISGAILPSAYRPAAGQDNIYGMDASSLKSVSVGSGGTITFAYRDFTGSPTAETSTGAGSISYIV